MMIVATEKWINSIQGGKHAKVGEYKDRDEDNKEKSRSIGQLCAQHMNSDVRD